MSGYLYETHMHTCQASACSDTRGRDYIQRYLDLGYTGIILTDHFFRGNCRIDRSLPWRERIHLFCSGYEDALEEGLKRGLDVFFGWEENMAGDEYLIYGLDKQWLLDHPEMEHWTRREQFEQVHRYGGCVIQAHPFRQRGYIQTIHLSPFLVDGVEVCNAGNEPEWNAQALQYGKRLGLPMTAGSDNHRIVTTVEERTAGVILDRRLTDIADYVSLIRSGASFGLRTVGPQIPYSRELAIDKPLEVLDREGNPFDTDILTYLDTGVWGPKAHEGQGR